ncbi:alpha/beta fold hydrolase [Lentisphaerota bacterium]|nr:alpha/beta fold hydrolase [Lentisphaerota bacterium]
MAVMWLMSGCRGVDTFIFQPPDRTEETLNSTSFTRIKVADDRTIAALITPNKNSKYVLLYSHGNGEDLFDFQKKLLPEYKEHGYSIVAYDYEGYGKSDGSPAEENCYRDIVAVYKYLITDLNYNPENIIVFGRSVGSGPSTYLAEKYPVGALILESAFMSTFQVVTSLPVPGNRFPNIDRIKKVTAPLLVIHGTDDWLIRFHHGRSLYAAAKCRKKFVSIENGGHNDLIQVGGKYYWSQIAQFVQSLDATEAQKMAAKRLAMKELSEQKVQTADASPAADAVTVPGQLQVSSQGVLHNQ